MEDRFYYRELECYKRADETLLWKVGKNDCFDLSLLPTAAIKKNSSDISSTEGSRSP